ncbi:MULTISPECIES: YfgG family protein [unclassified Serratia (in: enterobacteria)]|uniref:YfgG family protein n=1 Tax=unclassified Serratia (in: enterobacteria) TaxID=2647522 RepID=UPI00307625CD
MKRKTPGRMTKIVLLISFIILVGRLLYAAIVAIPHHQERSMTPGPQSHQIDLDNQ